MSVAAQESRFVSADGNCATTVQKVPCSSSATRSGAITGYERGITGYVRTRALHKGSCPAPIANLQTANPKVIVIILYTLFVG